MGNRIYDNEFERYVKEQADQHRLYPSDQVWTSIQKEIHGHKRWPALTFISVVIITGLVVGTVLLKPAAQLTVSSFKPKSDSTNTEQLREKTPEKEKNYDAALSVEKITQQTIAKALEATTILQSPQTSPSTVSNDQEFSAPVEKNEAIQEASDKQSIADASYEGLTTTKNRELPDISILRMNLYPDETNFSQSHFDNSYSFPGSHHANRTDISASVTDLNFILNKDQNNKKPSFFTRLKNNLNRFDFQLYITPSISYRRLVDDAQGELSKSYISALPYAANYVVDVNRVIQHKPAVGYEIGVSLGYNLGNKFAIRSGLQFNMREYDIDAYVHPVEPASIALYTGQSTDIINTITGFRNIPGSSPVVLKNRYYEISAPIGVDWRPFTGKFAWGIAASIQPTYTFDKEPFIITSNYKNYTDGSQLMRNWNINSNIETYLGYNTGKYRWQIGPQIRYQLLPTMANSYPIREYLIDYGLKVSLTRSLK